MKKLFYLFSLLLLISLSSCLDTVTEVTINPDKSGTMVTNVDLSKALGMIKLFSQNADASAPAPKNIDTTISFANMPDTVLANLSKEERELLKNATVKMKLNMDDEVGMMETYFPFKNVKDLDKIKKLSGTAMQKMDMGMGKKPAAAETDDANPMAVLNNFLNFTYTDNSISCQLDKAKYDSLMSDPKMEQAKNMMAMMGDDDAMTMTIKYHLPNKVKNYSGKTLTVSDDKKTVIIKNTMDDIFYNAKDLEYSFEY